MPLKGVIPTAFLPNYDMDTALAMVAGSDVWLNTPLRPLEASGTGGKNAAYFNRQRMMRRYGTEGYLR